MVPTAMPHAARNLFREDIVRLLSPLFVLRRFLLAAFAIFAFGAPAMAGWYQVENYEGEVGGKPIHISLQTYDFGSGITVEGSYYFDAERRPVAVYGAVKDGRTVLCEISSEAELKRIVFIGSKTPFDFAACPLVLSFDNDRAGGRWTRDGVDHAVTLKKVASLNDRGEPSIEGRVDIPFWAQTATHMIVGRYENTASGICLSTVGFINKASGKRDQELHYSDDPCNAGMLMTPIYMNVERWTDSGREILGVNFRDGRAGYSEDFVYDAAKKRFVKAP